MNVPFVHNEAAGLYLSDAEVCWVSLRTQAGRLRHVRCAVEPVERGDVRAALQRLVARVAPSHPYVATHLDPLHVRHALLDGPGFDDDEVLAAWVTDHAARRLPPGARLDRFIVRRHVLERSEDRTRCLLSIAPREAVEERKHLLAAVGLKPLLLSAVDADVGFVLAFQPDFLAGRAAVLLVQAGRAVLAEYRDGVFQATIPLAHGAASPDALAHELDEVFSAEAGDGRPVRAMLHVVGHGAGEVVARLQEVLPQDLRIYDGRLLIPAGRRTLPLAGAQIPAAALAMHRLYPALGGIDFLDEDTAVAALQEQEKREAVRVSLYAGGCVLAFTAAALLATTLLGAAQARTGAEMLRMADQVAEVEQARAALERLAQEVAQAERLVSERTHAAVALEQVGRAAPGSLWLEAIRLTTTPTATLQLSLQGAAFGEADLSQYLHRLEEAQSVREVRLVYSETVTTRRLYREAAFQDRPLVRFEIRLQWAPGAASETRQP